ncbi:MAG: hypothetical protein KDJ49_07710 [Alphaproteobacteria bacterium]|nr:hypothetical protein [Alphaproteobacteria bacterium]USO07495.1 MAG: hypothetical protein H6866_08790 [Rhodospirillales bacterium]
MKKVFVLAMLAAALVSGATLVSGCGVKPGQVKAPAGVVDTYPRAYPAPESGDVPR